MAKKKERNNPTETMRQVTVYLASRNSSGIHERALRVDANDRVHGYHVWRFLPWGFLSDVGTNRDWRTAHCFFTHDEARADYVALEKRRIEQAREALKQMAA